MTPRLRNAFSSAAANTSALLLTLTLTLAWAGQLLEQGPGQVPDTLQELFDENLPAETTGETAHASGRGRIPAANGGNEATNPADPVPVDARTPVTIFETLHKNTWLFAAGAATSAAVAVNLAVDRRRRLVRLALRWTSSAATILVLAHLLARAGGTRFGGTGPAPVPDLRATWATFAVSLTALVIGLAADPIARLTGQRTSRGRREDPGIADRQPGSISTRPDTEPPGR